MGKKNPILIFILLLFFIGGCASPPPKTTVSPEESGYIPRKVYFLDFDRAWEAALKGLGENDIAVGNQDKDLGIIRTDYQAGPDTTLLGKIYHSRYKYNIFFFKPGPRRTIMNIRCMYEIKEKEGKNYAAASDLLTDEMIAQEKKLYEILDSYLLAAEDSGEAVKKAPPPSPPPAPAEKVKIGPQETPPPLAVPPPEARTPAGIMIKEDLRPSPEAESKGKIPEERKVRLTTTKDAPLWEGPSAQARIILTLKKGVKVEKMGESGSWVQVRVWGKTMGWIPKNLLQEAP